MRVLMLSWEYPPRNVGGLGRHVQELSEALADLGPEVHVLTRGGEGKAEQKSGGVHVHRVLPYSLSSPDFPTWVLQLNLALLERAISFWNERGGMDIIHAHDWLVAFAGRVLKHVYQVPLIATVHATEAGRNQGLHNDLQRYIHSVEWWLTYEAWRVIVCSEHMRREVQGLFQLPIDKLSVIPNGVRAARFRQVRPDLQLRGRFAQPWEQLILFVGRLVREKGVHVLLDAAPSILASCPQAKFVLAGTGPEEGQLKHQAWAMGLQQKVYFAGYMDEQTLNQLYCQSAVAVFPSLYEPFGIVALEAMAARTPVVVSDTGGFSEIIRHGENGLKAGPGNASSLSANIIRLLQDHSFAEQLKERAARQVESVFDWSQIARGTLAIYQGVSREYLLSPWRGGRSPLQLVRRYVAARTAGVPQQQKAVGAAETGRQGSLVEQRMTGLGNRARRDGV